EGATAPETLRQKDREAHQTLERARLGSPTEQGGRVRRNLSGFETAGASRGGKPSANESPTPMTELKTTPLNAAHRALGARMVGFGGYDMPVQYEGVLAEHRWTHEHAGLFDVSHMGQARILGADAITWFERFVPGDYQILKD